MGSIVSTIGSILWVVIALGIVLGLAWLLLRWMNKRMPGLGGGSARMIQMLDRVNLGKSSNVVLLRVEDKVLLVAFTEHAVEKLQEFDDPEGKLKLPELGETPSFADALKDAAGKVGFTGKAKGRGKGKRPAAPGPRKKPVRQTAKRPAPAPAPPPKSIPPAGGEGGQQQGGQTP